MNTALVLDDAVSALRDVFGQDVELAPHKRALFGQDIFHDGAPVLAVVRPRNASQIQAAVAIARNRGLTIAPRGGGMSYTAGYLHKEPCRAIVLDLSAMTAICAIHAEDMAVVVEAGCTWQALDEALAPLGLRTPFWGTVSGRRASIGGSISQNAIFWGSGAAGTAADSVTGIEAVTGAGDIVRTGSLALKDAPPFLRHFGPDLTGLFTGDGGAMGVKTKIALRLERRAKAASAATFFTDDAATLCGFMSEIARAGLAAQQMALDAHFLEERVSGASLKEKVIHLSALLRGAAPLQALWSLLSRRPALRKKGYASHVFAEGDSAAHCAAKLRHVGLVAARRAMLKTDAAIAQAMLRMPFAPVTGLAGPKGERWAPVHAIVAHSQCVEAVTAIESVLSQNVDLLDRHAIRVKLLFTAVGASALSIEPMFLWPDALQPLAMETIAAEGGRVSQAPVVPEAAEAVALLRQMIVAATDRLGASHLQLGRVYPYLARLDPAAAALSRTIRALLDPDRVINPSVLDGDARHD